MSDSRKDWETLFNRRRAAEQAKQQRDREQLAARQPPRKVEPTDLLDKPKESR